MSRSTINKILDSNYNQSKPWNSRKICGDHVKVKNNAIKILDLISGSDKVSMLRNILTKSEINAIIPKKYKNVLHNFAAISNSIHKKKQHIYARALQNAGFSRSESKKLKFKIGRSLWRTCFDPSDRNLGGRHKIPNDLIRSINDHMKSISREASNRNITIWSGNPKKKFLKAARYSNISFIQAYHSFEYKKELNYSQFYKYIEPIYKKPHRNTDVCKYCRNAKSLKRELLKYANEYGFIFDSQSHIDSNREKSKYFLIDENDINCNLLTQFFQSLKDRSTTEIECRVFSEIIKKISDYQEYQIHKSIADGQRGKYNEQINDINLLETSVIIEIDFKQKIIIGLGPDQTGEEYYEQKQKTFISLGVFYKDKSNQIACKNFDLVSDEKQDGFHVVNSIKILRQQAWFKEFGSKKLIFWSDTGKHFRNCSLVGYLTQIADKEKIVISLNFFGECHGKNSRDTHFSAISNYIKRASLLKRITCTQEVVNAIINGQKDTNIQRHELGLKPILEICLVFIITDIETKDDEKFVYVESIETLYNLEISNQEIKTKLFSFYENEVPVKILKEDSIPYIQRIRKEEVKVPIFLEQNKHLKNKRIKMVKRLKVNHLEGDLDIGGTSTEEEECSSNDGNDEGDDDDDDDEYDETDRSKILIKPSFCNQVSGSKKIKACSDCKAKVQYLNSSNVLKKDLIEELVKHGHKRNRQNSKTKKQRNKSQTEMELNRHYRFSH